MVSKHIFAFCQAFFKTVALQLRRAKTDWSGCCQMAVQGALWLAKRLSLNFNFSSLNRIRYFSYQVDTQLSSRGWVDPVPDPILPEKFLRYSRESNPGPLGWQSDVLTTIPNRRSKHFNFNLNYKAISIYCCSMCLPASQQTGPGSIPGRVSFPSWDFSGGFPQL